MVGLLVLTVPDRAAAQTETDIGGHLGYTLGWYNGAAFIGGNAVIRPSDFPVQLNPGFDFFFVDNVTLIQIDANALYPLEIESDLMDPYVGGGLGIYYMSIDVPDELQGFGVSASSTDVGLNLIGGAVFGSGDVRPFAQGRLTTGSGSQFAVTGGLRFSL